jgi:hypothetical protein
MLGKEDSVPPMGRPGWASLFFYIRNDFKPSIHKNEFRGRWFRRHTN